MTNEEIKILIDKYHNNDLSNEEIKRRLFQLKKEIANNHKQLSIKERNNINETFKQQFKNLK